MDTGQKLTDEAMDKLEKRIDAAYREAYNGLGSTIQDYFDKFADRDEEERARMDAGEITPEEYRQWRLNQIGRGKRYEVLRDRLAERMTDVNETANAYVNDATPGIYSLNRNYAAYTIENVAGDVGFDLWDEQTVKRLIVEQPELMPYYPAERALKRGIDLEFGKKQITASVTSSILQGKSIKNMADDLQNRIVTMGRNSAIRTARTAVTGAQNAGRLDSYYAAEKMGIKCKKEWMATLDNRTRHSHAKLDGEVVDNDKKFSNGCRFPGDPNGPPAEIYNCRCTLVSAIDGIDTSSGKRRARNLKTGKNEVIENMTYQQWEAQKKAEDATAWNTYIKKGQNLSTDTKQWKEYRAILGDKVPNNVDGFQNLKYNSLEKWEQIKTVKKQTVFVENAQCITTPEKYTGYFLKPGTRHADEFFDVGYTEDDSLLLRYDMARQFDIKKAQSFSTDERGKERFRIYMNLGVDKIKRFRTAWIKDSDSSKPRIVTAFREDD